MYYYLVNFLNHHFAEQKERVFIESLRQILLNSLFLDISPNTIWFIYLFAYFQVLYVRVQYLLLSFVRFSSSFHLLCAYCLPHSFAWVTLHLVCWTADCSRSEKSGLVRQSVTGYLFENTFICTYLPIVLLNIWSTFNFGSLHLFDSPMKLTCNLGIA